eukprot:gene16221-22386_t
MGDKFDYSKNLPSVGAFESQGYLNSNTDVNASTSSSIMLHSKGWRSNNMESVQLPDTLRNSACVLNGGSLAPVIPSHLCVSPSPSMVSDSVRLAPRGSPPIDSLEDYLMEFLRPSNDMTRPSLDNSTVSSSSCARLMFLNMDEIDNEHQAENGAAANILQSIRVGRDSSSSVCSPVHRANGVINWNNVGEHVMMERAGERSPNMACLPTISEAGRISPD